MLDPHHERNRQRGYCFAAVTRCRCRAQGKTAVGARDSRDAAARRTPAQHDGACRDRRGDRADCSRLLQPPAKRRRHCQSYLRSAARSVRHRCRHRQTLEGRTNAGVIFPPPHKRRRGRRNREESTMDQKRYEAGLAKRRKVLGDAYVDRALQNVDDFNRDFQRLLTEYCWGETWGDETLQPRERSILNLGMIAALGKMEEFATHVRGALNNGLTPNEIRAVLTQIAIYCGIPVGVDCFRIAKTVLGEAKAR